VSRRIARAASFAVVVLVASCGSQPAADFEASVPPTSTIPPTASVPPTSLLGPSTADQQAILDDLRTTFGSPGAIALLRLNGSEWSGVSGTADLAGTALTGDSRFRVGSITKSIVAALTLDEVSRGDLSLDDDVGAIVPGVLRAEQPVTVRMLLDHTSGIFNVGDEGNIIADVDNLTDPALRAEAAEMVQAYQAGQPVAVSARLFVALAETHDRYFAPGTGCHYSNVNYQLVTMVLEQVTGMSLADLLRTRIFEPLGLRSTTLAPVDTASPDMRGYGVNAADGMLDDLTDDFLAIGNGGGGGVVSTAGELLTIMQAIVSGRLLPAPLVDDMKRATPQSGASYGLGLATYYLSCGTYFGHGGAIDGYQSIAIVGPDGADGVVVAVNLRKAADPNLLATAEALLCTG